ncbi:MAG TPA: molybdopterin-binding protein [archaeon]|nr:molybdopterin-binding protein [archaeon]
MEKVPRLLLSCLAVILFSFVLASQEFGSLPEPFGENIAAFPGPQAGRNALSDALALASQNPDESSPAQERPKIRAEIIAIGDELCYGRVYDTNSFWIADQITRRGVFVQRIFCVRDDIDDICSVLRDALSRKPGFIFITGGLGPTSDDKTREALSAVTNRKIVQRPDLLELIAEQKKVPLEKLPSHYAISTSALEGARCFPNPVGVSPVIIIDQDHTQIIALPGPPREVKSCFMTHLADMIQKATNYHSRSKRVFVRMHEPELIPLMTEVMKEIPETYVKALVGEYRQDTGMPIEIMTFGQSEEVCQKICAKAVEMLHRLSAEKGKELVE